ncbi:hypothetical protein EUGRSUZ_A02046 [Eucalyptus grandis]|uniref:Uncharacterized protein n=2 Tax=Eucalyptus grandis TaxID=71139 RepID=A0A059DGB1_EUCGR|nr:hypothetical protein EUGRSUZ_A02046 [Eucalyptus grandis]
MKRIILIRLQPKLPSESSTKIYISEQEWQKSISSYKNLFQTKSSMILWSTHAVSFLLFLLHCILCCPSPSFLALFLEE